MEILRFSFSSGLKDQRTHGPPEYLNHNIFLRSFCKFWDGLQICA